MNYILLTTISVIFILGYTDDVRDFMLRAREMDMLDGYVWVGVDLKSHEAIGWMNNDTLNDAKAREAFQGLISYTVAVPTSDRYKEFKEDVTQEMKDVFNITPNYVSTCWQPSLPLLQDSTMVQQRTVLQPLFTD